MSYDEMRGHLLMILGVGIIRNLYGSVHCFGIIMSGAFCGLMRSSSLFRRTVLGLTLFWRLKSMGFVI